MKEGIHPDYRLVVFEDVSANAKWLTRSTISSSQTTTWEDGSEYPLVRVDISSASHPFYTGKQKLVDAAGRVEKFRRRFANTSFAKKSPAEEE